MEAKERGYYVVENDGKREVWELFIPSNPTPTYKCWLIPGSEESHGEPGKVIRKIKL